MQLDWEEEDDGPWTPYSDYISAQVELLDLFEIPGPGPPPFHLVLPPPPSPPGHECSQPPSHFPTCPSRVEEPLSPVSPSLHVLSVIVAVCCLVILASCMVVFLLWKRRRRSKNPTAHLDCQLSTCDDYYSRRLNKYYSEPKQAEQCFFLDNTSACSLPLYEEIPRGDSEYQLLQAAPQDSSLFLLPAHRKPRPLPPPARSNRTFFTFHQRRAEGEGAGPGGGATPARAGRSKTVATLDIRSSSQSRSCDPCAYQPHPLHHHQYASPHHRQHQPLAGGRPGRLLLARLDHHAVGRLGQDSPLLLPKEAWIGGDGGGGRDDDNCWPTVGAAEPLTGSRLEGGTGVATMAAPWPRLSMNNAAADRGLGPPSQHFRHGGGPRACEAPSPSSPSDVTTTSTTSSETYGSKSTGSSASSSRSSHRGRTRP